MAKKKSRPWLAPLLKRTTKKVSKKVWARHKKNKTRRRKERQTARAARRVVATTRTRTSNAGKVPTPKVPSKPSQIDFSSSRNRKHRGTKFLAKHYRIAGAKDGIARLGHSFHDGRELRNGIITSDELEALSNYDSQEEWRINMLAARKERYRTQQARNRDSDDYGRLTMVYSLQQGVAAVKHVGFRPPAPRQNPKKTNAPSWQPQPRQQVARKRKNHIPTLVKAWGPQMQQNASKAMAADSNLSGAVSALQTFADTRPLTRSEIHDHLGKLAEFGKAYADSMDRLRATLASSPDEDHPGLPPEVLSHLTPLGEVGDTIVQCSQETLAAWEDYFAAAIAVAKDEHTPSKHALVN